LVCRKKARSNCARKKLNCGRDEEGDATEKKGDTKKSLQNSISGISKGEKENTI